MVESGRNNEHVRQGLSIVSDGVEGHIHATTHALRYASGGDVSDIRLFWPTHELARFLIENPNEPFQSPEMQRYGFSTELHGISDRFEDILRSLKNSPLRKHFVKTGNWYGFISNSDDPEPLITHGLDKANQGYWHPRQRAKRERPFLMLRDLHANNSEEVHGKRRAVAAAVTLLVFGGSACYAWYSHQHGKLHHEPKTR